MDRIRVALICHFSSAQIREQLSLFNNRWYKYVDYANWITTIIDNLRVRDNIELHVIAPHKGLRVATQEFDYFSVHYHFFRSELPFPFNYCERIIRPQSKLGFPRNRKHVKNFLSNFSPDIVVLIGAENAYYSITALDIEGTPLLIHLQTVYANPDRIKNAGSVDLIRWNTEIDLFKKTPYMACTGRMYYDLVNKYNPNAIVFPRRWPVSPFPNIPEVGKKYDFVYFARYLNRNKGFDNALEAMGLFIKNYPKCKFLAVGTPDNAWNQYEKRIKELNLENNLVIHGSFTEYIEMLEYVKQARFALLPITMDVLSGTILEAMRMGMPVVTCRTSGTPSLNEKRETVLISEIGDSNGLYKNMQRLFEDKVLQEKLCKNALSYIKELDECNYHNTDIMIEQFKAVIDHYKQRIPIPQELLFNKENHIDYRKL